MDEVIGMPIYTYACPACPAQVERQRSIHRRNAPEPCQCGAAMNRSIDATRGLQSSQPTRPEVNQPRPGAAHYTVTDIKVTGAKKSAIALRGKVDVDMDRVNVRGSAPAVMFIPDPTSGENPRLKLSDLEHDTRP
jgi:putative FmdB family regulatory protein